MQNAVDKSAKETKELLEAYGNKCRQLGVCKVDFLLKYIKMSMQDKTVSQIYSA